MALRDFRDLVCWQLCHELKCEVWEFTATASAARDFEFRDQIRGASASAPANIAEAFGRCHPADAARFLAVARASVQETRNHLIDAHDRRHLDDRLYWRLMNLARAALRTTANLMYAKQRQAAEDSRSRKLARLHRN